MNDYIAALWRHRVVVGIGLVAALVVAVASMYRIPSLEKRDAPIYTATARLLVTGADAPYVRTSITRTQELVRDEPASRPNTEITRGGTTVTNSGPPDVTSYVRAANLYPILVESDQVKAERERLFGPTEGIVTANAIYQVATPNRFTLSEVPVIQVFGQSPTEADAIKLTKQTAAAFVSWMTAQQTAAKVPQRERILIQNIQAPRTALASATTSPALAFVVFAGVAFGFCLLAIVLDRVKPSEDVIGEPVPAQAEAPPPPAVVAAPADRRKRWSQPG